MTDRALGIALKPGFDFTCVDARRLWISNPMKRLGPRSLGLVQLTLSATAIIWLWQNCIVGSLAARLLVVLLIAPASIICGLNGVRLLWSMHGASRFTKIVAIVSNVITGIVAIWGLATTCVGIVLFRSESELGVVLFIHPLRISGNVSDVESGKPISGLVITSGSPFGRGYAWDSPERGLDAASHYEKVFRFPFTQVTHSDGSLSDVVLRFSAPGYETIVSTPFRQRGGPVTFDVHLRKASQAMGVVTTPEGKPAVRANVLVLSKMTTTWISLGDGQVRYWQGDRIETDENGRFHLDRPAGEFRLLVADARGFGTTLGNASNSDIAILMQPWARIEGHWLERGRPANVKLLTYNSGQQWGIEISADVNFDPTTGRFIAPRVPSGPFTIYWHADRAPDVPRESLLLVQGEARAGETSNLECSTEFRGVTGQIVREGSVRGLNFAQCSVILNPVQENSPPIPDDLTTAEAKKAWWEQWERTDEGKAYAAESRKLRQFQVQSDGRFSCRFVTPGKYWLHGSWRDEAQTMGHIKDRQIEIPAGSGVFDVGQFTVQPTESRYLSKGDAAPSFNVQGVAGGEVSLGKRPGKLVLLDFWATDCPPCVEEIANVRKVFDRFRNDERLQIISLDMDANAGRAIKFIQANRMEWQQGFLAGGWENAVAKEYGVDAIPAIFLVGRDGKILARDLRESKIESVVADALRD